MRIAPAPGTLSPPPPVNDPDMHHGTCVTHVLWCMPGSLTNGFLWNQWQGKRSRHSRRKHNPQFYISWKRPMRYRIYPFETHLKPKSHENSFANNSFSSYPIVFKFGTDYCCVLCKISTRLNNWNRCHEISWELSLRWVSDGYPIAQPPWSYPHAGVNSWFINSTQICCDNYLMWVPKPILSNHLTAENLPIITITEKNYPLAKISEIPVFPCHICYEENTVFFHGAQPVIQGAVIRHYLRKTRKRITGFGCNININLTEYNDTSKQIYSV